MAAEANSEQIKKVMVLVRWNMVEFDSDKYCLLAW